MSTEVSARDSSQDRQANKMSSAIPKPYGELQHNATVFSYAEAAKGRSPSAPSTLPVNKITPDTAKKDGKRTSSSETRGFTVEASQDSTKRTASEGGAPFGNDFKVAEEEGGAPSSDDKDASNIATSVTAKVDPLAEKSTVAGQSQPSASAPSSPEYGTTSTSTLPKEEDMFSTGNGSSDSTSDKQSSTSQNGNRPNEKADVEKDEMATVAWDEEARPPIPILKEAAPPTTNVWKIRSQAQAKSKASANAQPSKLNGLVNGLASDGRTLKINETSTEPRKQDSRKKSKPAPGPIEDRPPVGFAKEKFSHATEKAGLEHVTPPPPPGDAISWPTPDSAVEDAKKKNHDRVERPEKDNSQAPKPHGKEKWVPVPYVPTVQFNTPLPQARRGGRGQARGGREGEIRGRNATAGGNTAEKSVTAAVSNEQQHSSSTGQDRGRVALNSNPATSNVPVPKPKRASSAGPITPREQRKNGGDLATPEKRKDGETGLSKGPPADSNTLNASRRPSVPTTTRESQNGRFASNHSPTDSSWNPKKAEQNNVENKRQPEVPEASSQPKVTGFERRSDGTVRSGESTRDFQGAVPSRERAEQRGDRGRGGYRGRGGNNHTSFSQNMANGHAFSNGHASHYQHSSATSSKPHSNHERFPSQLQGSTYQSPHHQPRHYRNNSRSQSIPQSSPYSRFSNGNHGGPPHLANLQTDLANEYGYLPANQGAMTAIPFNSFGEPTSVFGMVNLQMNYYFSVENLCKDMYLRSHMDSQGFVFLDLLARFNRIKQLTNDMELIRMACHHSPIIEYVNVDGIDRVRARQGWQQWVRKIEERDPSVQNDGPLLPTISPYSHTYEDRSTVSPGSNSLGNPMDNVQYQSLNGIAPPFGPSPNVAESNVAATKTPLSAAVSEFSPSVRYTNQSSSLTSDSHSQGSDLFTDARVENLKIIVRKPLNATAPLPPPFHSSSSRTFSNGSIDGRSISDELSKFAERQSRPVVNGDMAESGESSTVHRSRSPFFMGSPAVHVDNSTSPPVLWVKDKQNSVDPLKSLPNGCVYESYHDFRQDALKQRENLGIRKDHHSMECLYQFWSHFLIRNFNASMYEEFHRLALEDSIQRESTIGMRSLLQFYDESILGQKAVSDDRVAMDFVELVKTESSDSERPVFAKLRAVWRNGAFNMRNRSKLTKFVDPELKNELER